MTAQEYEAIQLILRRKLQKTPYFSANKNECYKEGIRVAMSVLHSSYKEGPEIKKRGVEF